MVPCLGLADRTVVSRIAGEPVELDGAPLISSLLL